MDLAGAQEPLAGANERRGHFSSYSEERQARRAMLADADADGKGLSAAEGTHVQAAEGPHQVSERGPRSETWSVWSWPWRQASLGKQEAQPLVSRDSSFTFLPTHSSAPSPPSPPSSKPPSPPSGAASGSAWSSACDSRPCTLAMLAVGLPLGLLLLLGGCLWCTLWALAWWPWPWRAAPPLHPLVFFPAFATSRLRVTLSNQTFAPECPPSASFEFYAGHILPWGMTEECVMKAVRVHFHPERGPSLASMFSDQPGVEVQVADFGAASCAPFYVPLLLTLQQAGLKLGKTLFQACYDFRTAPGADVTPGFAFLDQARGLVEAAFKGGGSQGRVYLGCHSNGCPMALALLQALPEAWVDKHVEGLIGYAGNWGGQGIVASLLFSGVSMRDFSTPLPSSAFTFRTWPSTFYTLPQPWLYNATEIIIQNGPQGTQYTPQDFAMLFEDAKVPNGPRLFDLFNGLTNVTLAAAPKVDAYMFAGSGLDTPTGTVLPRLAAGVLPLTVLLGVGDGNQEDTDNESIKVWAKRKGSKFEFHDVGRFPHALMPYNLRALTRTLQLLRAH